jgi:hypothetical protein
MGIWDSIKGAFNWLGDKMKSGWESVKSFGKKAWDKVKSVPVLGQIASGIEKYTPIGWAATSALKGIDAATTGTSKLFQGDLKGALQTGINYGRQAINAENPLITEAKKIPGIGRIVSLGQKAAESVPIYGGMSIGTMRSIGNSALNSADAFKEGDVKGGFVNALKAGSGYLGSKGGAAGLLGKGLNKAL